MAKDKSGKRDGSATSNITDPRFSNFETDPRFRLPSKKKTKTTIDKRFSRMLEDDEFTSTAKVDRYGRKLKSDVRKKALQRLYQEEDEEEEKDEEGEKDAKVDDDEVIQRELRAANVKYDPARGGGFSASESESDSDEDDAEDEEGGAELEAGPALDRFREEQAGVETGEVTNRIAIVNLDWDHIKAPDLMALFSSFVPAAGGRIEKISIYPSEFGKERMQREELEGPPKEIFKKKAMDEDDEEEDSEDEVDSEDEEDENADRDEEDEIDSDEEAKNDLIKEGNDQDFDSDALRSYQLDRLRYYYAVMVCSNASTAQKIYEATDGSEYMASSNFLDLRFVPDDVTFDDEPRDECDSVPTGYKPMDFVTNALQHSKVKLTWDMHPEELSRKESIKKAFSGSRAEIAENDLRAYLASDSEDEEDEEEAEEAVEAEAADGEPQLTKKELARRKMRAALGLSDEPAPKASKNAAVGDMQITFSSALTDKGSNKDGQEVEETTIEKYKRKERERKAKRKEKTLSKREGVDEEDADVVAEEPAGEDLGFDDPFFTSEEPAKVSKASLRKEERAKKREAKQAEEAENAAQKAQLELLMADNTNEQAAHLDHFDMNEIVRGEKQKSKKKKKKGKNDKEERGGLQEDFDMDVADSRFKAVFESHEFAIDPSNPKFKATGGMKKLLEEGRKRKAGPHGLDDDEGPRDRKKAKDQHGELDRLVDVVKKRSVKR